MYLFDCTIILLGLIYTIWILFILTVSIRSYNKYIKIGRREKVKTQYNINVSDFFLLEDGHSKRYKYGTYRAAFWFLILVLLGLFIVLDGVESTYYGRQTWLEGLIHVSLSIPFLSVAGFCINYVKRKIKHAGGFTEWFKKYKTLMSIEESKKRTE